MVEITCGAAKDYPSGRRARAKSSRKSTQAAKLRRGRKTAQVSPVEVKEHVMNTHEGSFKVVRDGQGRRLTATAEDTRAVHTRSQLKARRPIAGCRFTYIIAKTRPCTFSRASTRSSAETGRFAQLGYLRLPTEGSPQPFRECYRCARQLYLRHLARWL